MYYVNNDKLLVCLPVHLQILLSQQKNFYYVRATSTYFLVKIYVHRNRQITMDKKKYYNQIFSTWDDILPKNYYQ